VEAEQTSEILCSNAVLINDAVLICRATGLSHGNPHLPFHNSSGVEGGRLRYSLWVERHSGSVTRRRTQKEAWLRGINRVTYDIRPSRREQSSGSRRGQG